MLINTISSSSSQYHILIIQQQFNKTNAQHWFTRVIVSSTLTRATVSSTLTRATSSSSSISVPLHLHCNTQRQNTDTPQLSQEIPHLNETLGPWASHIFHLKHNFSSHFRLNTQFLKNGTLSTAPSLLYCIMPSNRWTTHYGEVSS